MGRRPEFVEGSKMSVWTGCTLTVEGDSGRGVVNCGPDSEFSRQDIHFLDEDQKCKILEKNEHCVVTDLLSRGNLSAMVAVIVILLVVIIILSVFVRKFKKKNELLAQQNKYASDQQN